MKLKTSGRIEAKLLYTLKMLEFFKKQVCHIPPHYLDVIRHYGLSASHVKAACKTITDKLLGKAGDIKTAKNWREKQTDFKGKDPLLCTIRQMVMVFMTAHISNPLPLVKIKLQSAFLLKSTLLVALLRLFFRTRA